MYERYGGKYRERDGLSWDRVKWVKGREMKMKGKLKQDYVGQGKARERQ